MSQSSSERSPSFIWLLAAFFGFAVLAGTVRWYGEQERPNPRDGERAALASEVKASHQAGLAKAGLVWGDSSKTLAGILPRLQDMKATTSAMLVPGSPTQLKMQAAAPAPAATPPAAAPTK
jgi:hypothetical protein